MMFLLELPPVLGALIAILLSLAFTCALFITAHFFLRGKRPDHTRTFVQQMALRIGTIHALVLALVFSALTSNLIKLFDMSDNEAISAARIYFILKGNQSEEAAKLRTLIPVYLKTVIEQDWKTLSRSSKDLPAWEHIAKMQAITLDWDTMTSSDEMLKGYVFDNLNTMAENRDKRIIEWQAPDLPAVFWAIAFLGYILTLLPYLFVELSKLRFTLICGYAIIIGLIFYGIAVLDKPFLSRVIKPASFKAMYTDVIEDSFSSPLNLQKK